MSLESEMLASLDFRKDLEALLNKHSMENRSNTPDFILAEFMGSCLANFEMAIATRSEWYRGSPSQLPEPTQFNQNIVLPEHCHGASVDSTCAFCGMRMGRPHAAGCKKSLSSPNEVPPSIVAATVCYLGKCIVCDQPYEGRHVADCWLSRQLRYEAEGLLREFVKATTLTKSSVILVKLLRQIIVKIYSL